MTRVGVLAVQGAFIEHERMLGSIGAECFEIRNASDLCRNLDALVIPGGESTVMGKLIRDLGMSEEIKGMISGGVPVLGTCAGLILLAEEIEGEPSHLATLPVSVQRNAYGRQLGSYSAEAEFGGRTIPLRFIRAPKITRIGAGVVSICDQNGDPVAVRYGSQVATSFHPELTDDSTVHSYFMDLVRSARCFIRFRACGMTWIPTETNGASSLLAGTWTALPPLSISARREPRRRDAPVLMRTHAISMP